MCCSRNTERGLRCATRILRLVDLGFPELHQAFGDPTCKAAIALARANQGPGMVRWAAELGHTADELELLRPPLLEGIREATLTGLEFEPTEESPLSLRTRGLYNLLDLPQ